MIVVDTNVISYFLIQGKYSDVAEQLFDKEPNWFAPRLWRSEFRNTLIKSLRADFLSVQECYYLMSLAETFIEGREYEVDSSRVLALASQSLCSAYDAEFIALARELRTYLITWDKKLIQQFPDLAVAAEDYLKS